MSRRGRRSRCRGIATGLRYHARFKYSLDALAKDILDDKKYKYDLQEKTFQWSGGMQRDPMSNMHKLPSHVVKDYAKQDVSLTLRLWNVFNEKLDKVLFTKYEQEFDKKNKKWKRKKDKNGNDIIIEEKTCRMLCGLLRISRLYGSPAAVD